MFHYRARSQRCGVLIRHRFASPSVQAFDQWGQRAPLDDLGGTCCGRPILAANFVYPRGAERQRGSHALPFALGSIAPSAGIEIICSRHPREQGQGRFLVNELSTHGFLGTYWYDVREKGTSYKVLRVTPHVVATKDHFYRPTAMALGPDGTMYSLDLRFPGRAPEVALQAARFPMDAGMYEALDDTMDSFERFGSIRP